MTNHEYDSRPYLEVALRHEELEGRALDKAAIGP